MSTVARSDLDAVLAEFPASAAMIRQAAMRIAMQRAVIIISEYMRSRQELRASMDTTLQNKKSAHASLTSAFGHSSDPSADPAMILRLITGSNLRDIVDGKLVEEVGQAAGVDDARQEREERAAMRRELATVKNDVSAIKEMITKLHDSLASGRAG